jgi:hypothetical protein
MADVAIGLSALKGAELPDIGVSKPKLPGHGQGGVQVCRVGKGARHDKCQIAPTAALTAYGNRQAPVAQPGLRALSVGWHGKGTNLHIMPDRCIHETGLYTSRRGRGARFARLARCRAGRPAPRIGSGDRKWRNALGRAAAHDGGCGLRRLRGPRGCGDRVCRGRCRTRSAGNPDAVSTERRGA